MTSRLQWIGAIGAVAVAGVLVWAFTPPAELEKTSRLESGKTYRTVDGIELKADVAVPSGTGPFPAVICLHSGGWVAGKREEMSQTLAVLARRGFVAVSPDYRLAPAHKFPACLDDCKAVLAWVRSNAAALRVDPRRIGLMGMSSGGHLATLTALSVKPEERVQALASFSTPFDLSDPAVWTEKVAQSNLTPLLGGHPRTLPALCKEASPLHRPPQPLTPMFFVHGSEDKVVPLAQAQAFRDKAGKAGGSVHLMVLQGEGHTWDKDNLLRSIDNMLTFLDETLKR